MTQAMLFWRGVRDIASSVAHARDVLDRQVTRRAAIARATRELDSYSAEDLAELGLMRSDIPRVARQSADQIA